MISVPEIVYVPVFSILVGLTAELLIGAINRRDRLEAQRILNALLSEPSAESGIFEVIYHATPAHTSAPTFTYVI
jgi:hypothetical protein